MKKISVLMIFLCFDLLLFSVGTTVSSQVITKRNLKDYEAGPTFDDTESYWAGAVEAGSRRKIDLYTWNLWSNKRLAYFVVNNYNRHGVNVPCTHYLEKGNKNLWQFTVECDRVNICPYISKYDCEKYRYVVEAYDKVEASYNNGRFELVYHRSEK